MAVAKKKPTIDARDIVVDNRKLNAVLLDLAELSKESATRSARADERSARADERAARLEAVLAECALRSARAEERSARAEERAARAAEVAAEAARRSARAEELAEISLQTISALTRDHMGLAQRTEALEKAIAAE
jgi:hypothetical protein